MPFPQAHQDERAELLATVQHALRRTLMLARQLETDPLVGAEARAFLSRLECIQAEVAVAAAHRDRQRPLNDDDERLLPTRLWQ